MSNEVTEKTTEKVIDEVIDEVNDETGKQQIEQQIVETIEPSEPTLTREQIRARLKEKIKNKKSTRTNGITRKHSNNLNDSIKKIGDVLAEDKIQSIDQINEVLVQKVMSAISKEDLEIILNHMQKNSQLKEILSVIKNKMSE